MISELIYNAGIKSYSALMGFAAFVHPKAKKWVEGRKGLRETLLQKLSNKKPDQPVAWFHAASLGEFEQGRPVIERFRNDYPDFFIVLTFFSPSGYEIRKNYPGADLVCYLPPDTPSNARWWVQQLNPSIAFFIKYEFWFNYLDQLKHVNCTVISFSTIFRPQQLFFKPYGGFYRKLLHLFDYILVQDATSIALLKSIGYTNTEIAGDTRFDRVVEIAAGAKLLPEMAQFVGATPCLVVGSAWEEDMLAVTDFVNNYQGALKLIVAPHEINESTILKWRQRLSRGAVSYSEYKSAGFSELAVQDVDCLFLDNIGMLSSIYQFASAAWIGGGFRTGLHNVLEAATFGVPVVFGNENFTRFKEAIDLNECGGGFAIDSKGATSLLQRLFTDTKFRTKAGQIAKNYVSSHTGASGKIMEVARQFTAR